MRGSAVGRWLKESWPQLLLLLAGLIVNAVISPSFFDIIVQGGRLFGGVIDVLVRAAPTALLAMGMALVIGTRGIDLSVGAVMAIAGAAAATAVNLGCGWEASIVLALVAGLVCGLWNGMLVAWLGIEPIVATLILMVAGRGGAQLITKGRIVTFIDPHLAWFGSGAAIGLPVPILLVAAALILLLVLLRASALGLFVEAVGVNPSASRLAGIRTQGILLSVYAASGILAAIAGVIATADIKGADANNAGLWLELDAILAVVIGGGSLYGGRFSVSRALVAALALQTLKTAILRAGLPPQFNLVAMAAAIAVVLCFQSPVVSKAIGQMTRVKRGAA